MEVKIALAMRDQQLRNETVVMDRPVCGTLEADQADPFTCDKYLSRFLPPGARLRVVQPDGTVNEYTGTETEHHDHHGPVRERSHLPRWHAEQ